MAEPRDEPEPFMAGPGASGLIAEADLTGQAQRLGQQHRAAGINPVRRRPLRVVGRGKRPAARRAGRDHPHHGGQRPRAAPDGSRLLRRTASPRGRRYRARLMTVPCSPGGARGLRVLAEDGESDSW
jgi:hypothetical protein